MLCKSCGSSKGEVNNLQIKQETIFNTAKTKLSMALERYNHSESDLVHVKENRINISNGPTLQNFLQTL